MYPHHDIFKGASGICFEEEEEDFNWTYNGQFLYKICELWFTAGLGSQRRLSHHKKKYFSFLTWWGFFPFWVTEQHDRFFFFFHCRISSWEQQNCLLCRSLQPLLWKPSSIPRHSQAVWCVCLISLALISSHYSAVQDLSPIGCSRPPQRAMRWEQITLWRVIKAHGVGVEGFLFSVLFYFLCLRHCVQAFVVWNSNN